MRRDKGVTTDRHGNDPFPAVSLIRCHLMNFHERKNDERKSEKKKAEKKDRPEN